LPVRSHNKPQQTNATTNKTSHALRAVNFNRRPRCVRHRHAFVHARFFRRGCFALSGVSAQKPIAVCDVRATTVQPAVSCVSLLKPHGRFTLSTPTVFGTKPQCPHVAFR
jgi:hypothetical protein